MYTYIYMYMCVCVYVVKVTATAKVSAGERIGVKSCNFSTKGLCTAG